MKQHGITIVGGNKLNQLCRPAGISIGDDDDQTIYIADWGNHRIVKWKSNEINSQIVVGENQLNFPTDVIIDQDKNSLIIADRGNRRVMRWSHQNKTNGEVMILVGQGADALNQLYYPIALSFDRKGNLYVVDSFNHRIQKFEIESPF